LLVHVHKGFSELLSVDADLGERAPYGCSKS